MTRNPRAVLCERARSWAALAPDGELSELEQRLLDAHLARCGGCRRFAVHVAQITDVLRREALVPLPDPLEVAMWRRPSVYARIRTVSAAAAVAVMALGIAARSPLPMDSSTQALRPAPARLTDEARELNELRDFRREMLVQGPPSSVRHFGDQPA